MNYTDYFKKESITVKLKDAPNIKADPNELKIGIKHEKEHSDDEKIAKIIALQHLKEDPHYYTRLHNAGIKECSICGCGMKNDLPKFEDGSLAVNRLGPVKIAKIIPVGKELGGIPATGELSGYTSMTMGVNQPEDKETITAGGQKVNSDVVTKSVGGPIPPGEGQVQGGPNSQGKIAQTPKNPDIISPSALGKGGNIHRVKFDSTPSNEESEDTNITLSEMKKVIRFVIKEALKENIKATGTSYKVANRSYRTIDDDNERRVQVDPEIQEVFAPEDEPETKKFLLGGQPGEPLKQTEYILVDIKGNRGENAIVKDTDTGKFELWGKHNDRPAGFALQINNRFYEFVSSNVDLEEDIERGSGRLAKISNDTERKTRVDSQIKVAEAGGAAIQRSSYRTINDVPQNPKNRHRGDIDESVNRQKVSQETVGLINGLIKNLKREFNTDYSFTIFGKGKIIAANDKIHGIILPSITDFV